MNFVQFLAQPVTTFDQGEPPPAGVLIAVLLLSIIVLIGMWKMLVKAGQPGWAALIPIYNVYVLLKVAHKPGWWLLLFFIPFVNIIIAILVAAGISRAFGRGTGTTLGLIFLPWIFYPILGFGDAQWRPPEAFERQGFPVNISPPAAR